MNQNALLKSFGLRSLTLPARPKGNAMPDDLLKLETRRHFFSRCPIGVGSMALWSMLAREARPEAGPLAPKKPHFPAKAKSVIFMFMAGGPSQLELFDYKPVLAKLDGKPIPESYIKGKRFAFMDSSHRNTLLAGKRPFKQHGKCGAWVSDLMPYTAKIVDELTFIR